MNPALLGLSTRDADALRARFGPNAIPAEKPHPLKLLAAKLWAPVPWLLEATFVLTLLTGRYADAVAILVLLVFNATVATIQEGNARDAIDLLRSKVNVRSHVLRDGTWRTLSGDQLVPGDVIQLGTGAIVPADASVCAGTIAVDQSMLTGESVARTASAGDEVYAGSTVVRGDATCRVTSTAMQTKFGKTVELFHATKTPGELERFILHLVTLLTTVSIAVIAVMAFAATRFSYGFADIAIFSIMILLASVPIALPAAFTLATTLGSVRLAREGALVTRLSALEDAASMDVLCTDKTGTITENRMSVVACRAFGGFSDDDVAALAAAASDVSVQDPIDLAVLAFAEAKHLAPIARQSFAPFEPLAKQSSAVVAWRGATITAIKGSPDVLALPGSTRPNDFVETLRALSEMGRVVAVAVKNEATVEPAGLIAIADTPRHDARTLIEHLGQMGIRVEMLTGDTPASAARVASQVGIPESAVHASIYPDDKVGIIVRLQRGGHVVGMTGDGVNDAPALRAAGIGIAVSTATDVAKAAAGIVLTEPGLTNVLSAVETSRAIFERMVTYTLMKIVKFLEIVGVLSVGFLITHGFLLTPDLMVAMLIFNDGVTLSVSTDNVVTGRRFTTWRAGRLVRASLVPAIATALAVAIAIFAAARLWHASFAQLRSVTFLSMVVMGQISVYIVRNRSPKAVLPSRWLALTTAFAVLASCGLVVAGVLASPLPAPLVGAVVGLLLAFGAFYYVVFSLPALRINT